jgi:hypothetical protein
MMRQIYALGSDRSLRFVAAFLDRFLPDRERILDELDLPDLTDDDIMDFLEHHPWESCALQWRAPGATSVRRAMAFYTVDRQIVLALVERPERVAESHRELIAFVGATHSMVTDEAPPPESAARFIQWCTTAAAS